LVSELYHGSITDAYQNDVKEYDET